VADYLKRHPEKNISSLKAAFVASEVLTEAGRETIERNLRVPIFNHYGLAEQIMMLGECEEHQGLHHYDEYGYMELIDIKGSDHKRIIGTNFNNFAMPHIHYDTGDFAVMSENKCTCSRSSLIVENIGGRVNAPILCEGDFEISSQNINTMLEPYQDYFVEWQFV